MSTSLEERRRRAAYRAAHRGTKEMDWLLGHFAEDRLPSMTAAELESFERLLALPDPDLQQWIMTGVGYERGELAPLIAALRLYHGLASEGG